MSSECTNESWLSDFIKNLETLCCKLDKRIDDDNKQRKKYQERIEEKSQFANAQETNIRLKQQSAELTRRCEDINKACKLLEATPTLSEGDQIKYDNAKEEVQIAKELTCLRLDFPFCTEHPNKVRGFVKNEYHREMEPFEMDVNSDALWAILQTPSMLSESEENQAPNKF